MKKVYFALSMAIVSAMIFGGTAFAWYSCPRSYDGNKSFCFPDPYLVRMVEQCGGNVSDYYVAADVTPEWWESIKNQSDPCNTTWIDEQASGYE